MILAHPDSDLSRNLMVLSADIVRLMNSKHRKDNFSLIEDVMEDFLKLSDFRTPEMFLNSLTFLYIVGVVEQKDYRIKLLTHAKADQRSAQMELF